MWIVITILAGCGLPGGGFGSGTDYDSGSESSGTPSDRPHNIKQSDDGVTGWHAQGYEMPFLCLDSGGNSVTCPDNVWPDRSELSCDSSGCHGSYGCDPATSQDSRNLNGTDCTPSCFDCHDKEWNSTRTADGIGMGKKTMTISA